MRAAAPLLCALVACVDAPAVDAPEEPPPMTAAPTERIEIDLRIGQPLPVPALGITVELIEARRGHTASGGFVGSGRIRLSRGGDVVEHAYDRDGPFEALGVQWGVWGAGSQLIAYPPGAPIEP